jgi:hypothetical protein
MAFGFDDAVAAGLQVLNKFIPDPAEKIKAEAALRDALFSLDNKQAEINAVEAGNQNLWVSGWRPALGWIGASAVAYQYLLRPFLIGLGWETLPGVDSMLFELVFMMLGFGGLRTYEKIKGVATK